MSHLSFHSPSSAFTSSTANIVSLRSALSSWVLRNYGSEYRFTVSRQRSRANAQRFQQKIEACSRENPCDLPIVGIVGAGIAGLFAGLILRSLGIECDIFESTDRVGGRINTWYSPDYDPDDMKKSGLYGEVGGMRVPQFSVDMLPVQQVALAVNAVLDRNGLGDNKVRWRKFYYNSPRQRLRYNNMPTFTTSSQSVLHGFNFGQLTGGDVPAIWLTPKSDSKHNLYLPISKVLDQVTKPFLDAIHSSFAEGSELLMQFDQYSMWDYLTTQFRLGDMDEYYDPHMGAKNDLLPWSVASFLETTNVGSGMYTVSFLEMVIAVYDWGGSKDPYRPGDNAVYMLTVDKGMQHFPDACRTILDMADAVSKEDGQIAQIQVGMLPSDPDGSYTYNPPNLTPDAQPSHGRESPSVETTASRPPELVSAIERQRVNLQHKVVSMQHDAELYDGHGGMRLVVRRLATAEDSEHVYPYVITTLPNGCYLNGENRLNLLDSLSVAKAQAIRESNYMSAFKAILTFKKQFWIEAGERQGGYGTSTTDQPIRQIIYPSYGYNAEQGVLQIYCWALDARRLGALTDRERIEECLKGIQHLYPDMDIYEHFAGYNEGITTKTWFWDEHSGGGAFALFNPNQFKYLYPTLLTPEFDGCLNFAGEGCSVHQGWIVGALDSAYNAVLKILQQADAKEKIQQMKEIWGAYTSPDIECSAVTANQMSYAYQYSLEDRNAGAVPPNGDRSIYRNTTFIFAGLVPAFVADYNTVPQKMKSTIQDTQVRKMLNSLWDENVAQRAKQPPKPVRTDNAVAMLEDIYYGNNFQSFPAPRFWLKDDDEFARQQLAGCMPNLLTRVTVSDVNRVIASAEIPSREDLGPIENVLYIADYRRYLSACTVIPEGHYLAKPIVFFTVTAQNELMPLGIQLESGGELFTPNMANAANAWLLAKMQTNCAGQTLHSVGFHQLLTHQICAMVSISLFSEEVFNPLSEPGSSEPFQQHPVFKLLRPHVVKTLEFQQTIYNGDYDPTAQQFPITRTVKGTPGAYNIGSIYDSLFSCGRIGNYQLQDRIYNDSDFRFLDLAIPIDAATRGVSETPFSYPYVHDASLWYKAIFKFVNAFVNAQYPEGDRQISTDVQLQRFFNKLIYSFNYIDGIRRAQRFPSEVNTADCLKQVLTMFIWQFSVQHTVVNDATCNHTAFVPNASSLMYAPPQGKCSSDFSPADVLLCLPSQSMIYEDIENMTFMDIQIKRSVTGQGPYPETVFGRGVLEPSINVLYAFRGRDRAPQDCMPDSSSLSDQAALPCIAEFMDPAAVMASPHRDDGQSRLAP